MQTTEVYTFSTVEVMNNGTVNHCVYWSLDGDVWGLVWYRSKRDKFANFGSCWEAAIEGLDEYSHTIAQTWYASVEDSIISNTEDFDNPPDNLKARIEVIAGEWNTAENAAWKAANLKIVGRLSCGDPYYGPNEEK